jgi:hypothetical protein
MPPSASTTIAVNIYSFSEAFTAPQTLVALAVAVALVIIGLFFLALAARGVPRP